MNRVASDSGPAGLTRAVSRWEIVGLALNDVVGSGVYLLPAGAALLLGWVSVWAVVAAGAAVLLVVLCFAEAASHFDGPGSAYLYARTAFGDFVGFEEDLADAIVEDYGQDAFRSPYRAASRSKSRS